MSFTQVFNLFPGYPLLSGMMVLVLAVVLSYLARTLAHKAIHSLSRLLQDCFRIMADSVLHVEERLEKRNKEVMLTAGAEAAERLIDREFQRVEAVVKRDLNGFPSLHRSLTDLVTRIDEDYRESAQVPQPSPDWVQAVDSLAQLESKGDKWPTNIMAEMHKTAVSQHKRTMEEYRHSVGSRHALLEKMRPHWQRVSQTLDQVGKTVKGLHERASILDKHMAEYEDIRKKTDKATRRLASSAMTQFCISAIVLVIAIGGAMINFNLIALPMSEMVGGGSYIGNFKTSDIAALVIILVELAMGLYLLESLRITRLFPLIGQMDDKMRIRMIWVTFSILLILAGVESALAFMRDRIAADMQALRQTLAQAESPEAVNSWIPTIGQMVMGFILPFALTFVAIPLESFVQSSRTVIGAVTAAALRGVAFVLRLLADVTKYAGDLLVNLYVLLPFPLLRIEYWFRERRQMADVDQPDELIINEGV